MSEGERRREDEKGQDEAEKHAEKTGVPEGSTPEAVAEEEATGGALTNRGSSESGADEAEDPPSPS